MDFDTAWNPATETVEVSGGGRKPGWSPMRTIRTAFHAWFAAFETQTETSKFVRSADQSQLPSDGGAVIVISSLDHHAIFDAHH